MLRLRPVVFACLCCGLSMIAHAQDRHELRYLVGVQPPLTEDQEKNLTEHLVDADPSTSMDFDRISGIIEVRANQPVQREQFETLLRQMRAPSISSWRSVYPRGTMSSPMDTPGSPVYFDTGNPTADDARYEADKIQWLKNNEPRTEAPLEDPK
ncbi:MAG: hypothetical protein IPP33_11315 [Flavobacteriales bacterium]|nr:hypothetical protein [Flavobacteriales bacterium]